MDEEDFDFDEEVDLEAELTPEEREAEIMAIAEDEAREMARIALNEEIDRANAEKQRHKDKLLADYRQDWQKKYGVDPTKSELWKIGREREIKKRYGGPEQLLASDRDEFIAKQKEKLPTQAASKIQRKLRDEILCVPCTNLTTEEQAVIEPLRLIHLKVDGKCVCYDVVNLYEHLKQKYGTSTQNRWFWRDPTYDILYSPTQSRRISNSWAKVRPEGTAKDILATDIALSRMPRLPKK